MYESYKIKFSFFKISYFFSFFSFFYIIRKRNCLLLYNYKNNYGYNDYNYFYNYNYSIVYNFSFFEEYLLFRTLLIKNFTNYIILEKNINANQLINNDIFLVILKKIKKKNKKKYRILYFNEILELFFISFKVKVISGLIIWIRKYLEKHHFKLHKIFISFIFMLLTYLIWDNKKLLKIIGIRCFFKGKLGRGGNSRKSKINLQLGKISYSAKSVKLIQKKSIIWTKTGSVGFGLELFYNCWNLHCQ